MSYLQQLDEWLIEQLSSLEPGVEIDGVREAIREKILESYHNGQRGAQKNKTNRT